MWTGGHRTTRRCHLCDPERFWLAARSTRDGSWRREWRSGSGVEPRGFETEEPGRRERPGQGQWAVPTMHAKWLTCTAETGAARVGTIRRGC